MHSELLSLSTTNASFNTLGLINFSTGIEEKLHVYFILEYLNL